MNIFGVVFNKNGKVYYFFSDNLKPKKGDNVIVETERGLQFGCIEEVNVDLQKEELLKNIKSIVRIATKSDYEEYLKNLKEAEKALKNARKLSTKLDLDMNIISAAYTFDRKQLVFNFVADERIDFRELVKNLAATYKTRIELHQIGARDKEKMINGLGICGRELCCASFLNKMDTISINMAKNQNLSLNPTKINGLCGRLLCCLQYEDDNYLELRKDLPSIGDIIKTEYGKGEVVDINILNQSYIVLIDNEKKEIIVNGSKSK